MNQSPALSLRVLILPCILFMNTQFALASDNENLCFDLKSPIKSPLRTPIPFHPGKDTFESGKLEKPKKGLWGSARGEVKFSIKKVYDLLLDHYIIKSPDRIKLRVYPQDRIGYQDFHLVMVTLPTPIIDIKWEEEWGYVITQGTEDIPQSVVISYQKSSGTSYVPHLCGSIVLNSLSPTSTDVYLYEEINALGKRSHEDTIKGHLGTLETLRKKGLTPEPVASPTPSQKKL